MPHLRLYHREAYAMRGAPGNRAVDCACVVDRGATLLSWCRSQLDSSAARELGMDQKLHKSHYKPWGQPRGQT